MNPPSRSYEPRVITVSLPRIGDRRPKPSCWARYPGLIERLVTLKVGGSGRCCPDNTRDHRMAGLANQCGHLSIRVASKFWRRRQESNLQASFRRPLVSNKVGLPMPNASMNLGGDGASCTRDPDEPGNRVQAGAAR